MNDTHQWLQYDPVAVEEVLQVNCSIIIKKKCFSKLQKQLF